MKKFMLTTIALLTMLSANAETIILESNVNMENYWTKNCKNTQKVLTVGRNLIHANDLKRAPLRLYKEGKIINAFANTFDKSVEVASGTLPYLSNDDELAFVIGHELAHAQDYYDGMAKLIAMQFNSKKYEYSSDLKSLDYMVAAGYNPIAGIIAGEKIFGEPVWDWGFLSTHPKGSKRLMSMYEHIYKKYPSYLNSPMAKNVIFIDFLNQNQKEIASFQQKQAKKQRKLESL